ncbi:hypothetical protein EBB07_06045 [Paenibacillaceae bacterium]|nr:hypothetical protein EBB07_06045 [Paenibacillaceae bacterium]
MSKTLKNLSLQAVKTENTKRYKDKKRIQFDQAKLDVELVFRPSKRDEVIAEYISVFQDAIKNGTALNESGLFAVTAALIVKHFTSLETNAATYPELIELLAALKDGDYLDKILGSFDELELQRMIEQFSQANTLITEEMKKSAVEQKRANQNKGKSRKAVAETAEGSNETDDADGTDISISSSSPAAGGKTGARKNAKSSETAAKSPKEDGHEAV